MLENTLKFLGFVGIVGVIVVLGWNEPLRYRFMSRAEIALFENPPPRRLPVVQRNSREWMFDENRKTPLDREPYNQKGGATSVLYR